MYHHFPFKKDDGSFISSADRIPEVIDRIAKGIAIYSKYKYADR